MMEVVAMAGRRRCVMSALYDGWDLPRLCSRPAERTDGVVALCRVVPDYEDAGEDARSWLRKSCAS